MKTKTDYFTKFICVLSLFLITNMILFTSCDNGNSPNDNTNEEQNNNAPTDYCKICDGVQDNNHQHDYCDDCEGIDGKDHICPKPELPATDICNICEGTQTDASHYFHVETIGGEGSAYKVAYPDFNKYFDDNYDVQAQRLDPQKMMQDFQDNYENYINSLEFSDKFKVYCADKGYQTPADIDFKTFDEYSSGLMTEYTSYKNNFDYLIGSTTDDYNKSINDICKPIFEDITKNIKTENASLDKKRLYYYFRALSIHNLKSAYSLDFEISDEKNTYDTEKSAIISGWDVINQDTTSPIENIGTDIDNGCHQITEQMSSILAAAANQMGVELSDLQNIVNLANVMESLTSTRSITKLPTSHSHEYACPTNTMADTIKNAAKTASIQNTSGIEYC